MAKCFIYTCHPDFTIVSTEMQLNPTPHPTLPTKHLRILINGSYRLDDKKLLNYLRTKERYEIYRYWYHFLTITSTPNQCHNIQLQHFWLIAKIWLYSGPIKALKPLFKFLNFLLAFLDLNQACLKCCGKAISNLG